MPTRELLHSPVHHIAECYATHCIKVGSAKSHFKAERFCETIHKTSGLVLKNVYLTIFVVRPESLLEQTFNANKRFLLDFMGILSYSTGLK